MNSMDASPEVRQHEPRLHIRLRPRPGRGFVALTLMAAFGFTAQPANAQTALEPADAGSIAAATVSTSVVPPIWTAQGIATGDLAKVLAKVLADSPPGAAATVVAVIAVTSTVPTTIKRSKKKTVKPTAKATNVSTVARLLTASPTPGTDSSTAAATTPSAIPPVDTRVTTSTSPQRPIVATDARVTTGNPDSLDVALAKLRQCESGGRYNLNTGNGYYGAYQFALSTWRRIGYTGYPHQAEAAVQDEAARKLQAVSGWGQWPACSRKIGLR